MQRNYYAQQRTEKYIWNIGTAFGVEGVAECSALQEFKKLVSKKYAPGELVSVKGIWRKGLRKELGTLARGLGCGEHEVLKKAGFTTYTEANHTTTEASLKTDLQDYYRGKKRVVIRQMLLDSPEGSRLYAALRDFAGRKFGKKRTSLALHHFGYKTNAPVKRTEGVEDALRALWPKEQVEKAYQGIGALPNVSQLKKINEKLYCVLKSRGIVDIVNSLYPGYPDLYTYVRAPQSPVVPANPEIVAKQLLHRFNTGQSIGQGLRQSPEEGERILYKRVMSLSPELFGNRPYLEVAKELLPGISVDDIKGKPGSFYATGTIGNLFLEWLLKWTLELDCTGSIYRDGFSRIFSAPLQAVYAERRIKTEDGVIAPDFLAVGQQNTAIEAKTGEHLQNPLSLTKKYDAEQQYLWDIEGSRYPMQRKVAVLHMKPEAVKAVGPRLVDSGYTVLGGEQFLSYLERFIELISASPWQKLAEQAAPRLHNLHALLEFYKTLAFKPAVLYRPGQGEIVAFAKKTLEGLVDYDLTA